MGGWVGLRTEKTILDLRYCLTGGCIRGNRGRLMEIIPVGGRQETTVMSEIVAGPWRWMPKAVGHYQNRGVSDGHAFGDKTRRCTIGNAQVIKGVIHHRPS